LAILGVLADGQKVLVELDAFVSPRRIETAEIQGNRRN